MYVYLILSDLVETTLEDAAKTSAMLKYIICEAFSIFFGQQGKTLTQLFAKT